jgi:PAS domain S-box-containing protein
MKPTRNDLLKMNENLKAKLEIKNHLFNHIYEISSISTGTPDFNRVLVEIVDHVMSGLNFDRAAILLLNRDRTRLECLCVKGFSPRGEKRALERPLVIKKHDCFETKAVLRGEPIFVEDTENSPEGTKIDKILNRYQERKSVLYVPLKVKGAVIGLIGVDRFRTKMEITQDDVESLAIFANQAANIIENTRLYKDLRDEKTISENIIRCSVNGIMVSDLRGRISNLNPRGEEILGITKEEAQSRLIQHVFQFDDQERLRIFNALKRKEDISPFEVTYDRKDGKKLTLGIEAFVVTGEKDDLTGVTLITDLTAKKRMADYMIRTERLAALGWIASGIAHEIRNPLAGIYTTVQNMENECCLDDSHRSDLQNILVEIDRVEGLIRELLDLARPVPLQIEELELNTLLAMTVNLIHKEAATKGVVITTHLCDDRILIMGDANRLRKVVLNLFINALESIGGSGKILVQTEILPGHNEGKRFVSIRISDNGIGIPVEDINKIFDPFFTTKSVGTGLGLTVSHKIIQDHKGIMEVESQMYKGTTFCVRLPISQKDSLNESHSE